MLLDLHLHTTRYSKGCSLLDPLRMVQRLVELGLSGGAITEHNNLWSGDELERLKEAAGAPDLFLVSGREVESDLGHLLLFGYTGPVEFRVRGAEITARVRAEGGAVIWAHPLRFGRWEAIEDGLIAQKAEIFDGFEALTPSHLPSENRRALALVETFGLTATGGSDAHDGDAVGVSLTRFDGLLRNLDDLIAAIKQGACRPEAGFSGQTQLY